MIQWLTNRWKRPSIGKVLGGFGLGWSKELWKKFTAIAITVFLVVPSLGHLLGFDVNNTLIWATGIVLLLYMIETREMRLQLVRQNEIAIQPVLIATTERRDNRPRIVLRNIGEGTALFVQLQDVVIPGERETRTIVRFRRVDYISPEQDAVIISDMTHEGPEEGDVLEGPREGPWADAFAHHLDPEDPRGPYEVTIHYEDINGQRRYSVMQMGRGGTRLLRHGKN